MVRRGKVLQKMKYLKIQNQGELDIRLVALMGGTTKIDNTSKIGQFGTGLKYAISYLVRTENKFKLFIGENEVVFESKDEVIGDSSFKEIYCNGKSMSITTRYGYQWKAWEAIREIWCNAIDEGKHCKEVLESTEIVGFVDTTTFYIEVSEDIEDVLTNWNQFFLEATPIFEDDKIAIYENTDKPLRIYKNNTLIHVDGYYESRFMYDFKTAELNELRQYIGYAQSVIASAILRSNKQLIDVILKDFQDRNTGNFIEYTLGFQYASYNKEHLLDIFDGYLFLHPDSDRSSNSKSVKVNKSLFFILQECGLMTEKVSSVRGRSYGGSGYGYDEDEEITYSEITNGKLENRINETLKKFKAELDFEIVIPKDSDFDVLITGNNEFVFSNDLHNQSDADLEATVLIALFQQKEGNIYKALKRLIKFARSNKAFEKIFFGTV